LKGWEGGNPQGKEVEIFFHQGDAREKIEGGAVKKGAMYVFFSWGEEGKYLVKFCHPDAESGG